MIASTVGFLTIVLAVWLSRADDRRWLKRLGWASVAGVILQGVLGGLTVLFLLPKPVSISHACLAQVFFCTTVAIALFTSPGWRRGAVIVEDRGWPSLRSLAYVTPALILLQIALGAGFRHGAIGIMPHVLGAIVIGSVILMFTVFTVVQFPKHDALRKSAWALAFITLAQVLLGIIAYFVRLTSAGATTPDPMMVVATVAHVALGALTMAASVVLAIQVLRHVRTHAAEAASGGVPATP
jgi:cytochrome c oxidase assembly protein subunit 15